MKSCGRLNVRKHREIRGSDKYVTFDISLEIVCLDKIALISQFSYTDVMMNMKVQSVVTPLSIFCGCSTQKTFWEGNFTGEEIFFSAVNMKSCGRQNAR